MAKLTAAQAQAKADELKQVVAELKAKNAKPQDIKDAEAAANDAQAFAEQLLAKEKESAAAEESSTGKKIIIAKELAEARGEDVKKQAHLFREAAQQIIRDLVASERGKNEKERAAKVDASVPEVIIVSYAVDVKNKRASVVADCGNYGRRKAEISLSK